MLVDFNGNRLELDDINSFIDRLKQQSVAPSGFDTPYVPPPVMPYGEKTREYLDPIRRRLRDYQLEDAWCQERETIASPGPLLTVLSGYMDAASMFRDTHEYTCCAQCLLELADAVRIKSERLDRYRDPWEIEQFSDLSHLDSISLIKEALSIFQQEDQRSGGKYASEVYNTAGLYYRLLIDEATERGQIDSYDEAIFTPELSPLLSKLREIAAEAHARLPGMPEINDDAFCVEQGAMGASASKKLGTRDLFSCLAVVFDPTIKG